MRFLALVALAACSSSHPAAAPEAVGSAKPTVDPWAVSAEHPPAQSGSAEPVPKWASDPPAVLRDKIIGVNSHIMVLKSVAAFPEYRDVLALAERTTGVVAAEPFIFTELQIAAAGKPALPIAIKGVDPSRVGRVLAIGRHMTKGTLDSLGDKTEPAPIVLGDDLARKLGVNVGDAVTVSSRPNDDVLQINPTPFRVTAMFHLDFDEYDERLALVPLSPLQKMIGRGDQVMGIEMTVKDLVHSDDLAKALEKQLGGSPYHVMDWYELNKNLFQTLYGDRRP